MGWMSDLKLSCLKLGLTEWSQILLNEVGLHERSQMKLPEVG